MKLSHKFGEEITKNIQCLALPWVQASMESWESFLGEGLWLLKVKPNIGS